MIDKNGGKIQKMAENSETEKMADKKTKKS